MKATPRYLQKKTFPNGYIQLDFETRSKVVTFLADEGQVLLSFKKLLCHLSGRRGSSFALI